VHQVGFSLQEVMTYLIQHLPIGIKEHHEGAIGRKGMQI
jgi:hypothetical protein